MPLQAPRGGQLPQTNKETYAEALKLAQRELHEAKAALQAGDCDATRARYARALYDFDRLQAMFPFVLAGGTDVQA